MEYQRHNILGVQVSAINMHQAQQTIASWVQQRAPHYVCITGVHGVIESQDDPQLRQIHNQAGMVTPDGMPLVWLMKRGGHRHVTRVYGPDLMLAVFSESVQRGYRHFFYGGADGIADLLAERLQQRFPGVQIAGTYCPPFRPLTADEDAALIRQIDESQADIVWVGLSTPKQERWMSSHVGKLQAPVLIGVGAAFDFHAGVKKQAPLWMQHNGLEWLFRLATEPKRLWKRYLYNNPRFIYLVAQQLLKVRQFEP